jgi:hypothetical protein
MWALLRLPAEIGRVEIIFSGNAHHSPLKTPVDGRTSGLLDRWLANSRYDLERAVAVTRSRGFVAAISTSCAPLDGGYP